MSPVPIPEFNSANMNAVIGALFDKIQDPTNHIGGILEKVNPKGFKDIGKINALSVWHHSLHETHGKNATGGYSRIARNEDFDLKISVKRTTAANWTPRYNVEFKNEFVMNVTLVDPRIVDPRMTNEFQTFSHRFQTLFDGQNVEYDPMIHKNFNDFILNDLFAGLRKNSALHIAEYNRMANYMMKLGDITAKYR